MGVSIQIQKLFCKHSANGYSGSEKKKNEMLSKSIHTYLADVKNAFCMKYISLEPRKFIALCHFSKDLVNNIK